MTAAQSSSPQRAEGRDSTGAVRTVLGPDGLPETIRLEPDWQRVLDPACVGDAVVEAARVAANQRLAAWTRALDDRGWTARADRLRADLEDEPESAAAPAADLPGGIREARPRAMELLAEDVLAELDKANQFPGLPAMAATGTGSDRSRRVTIVVSKAGLTSCAVDPRWAVQQSGSGLSSGLAEALAAARTDLARAAQHAPNPMAQLDRLLGEALALLADPRRLADS
jgi:hypothetical protein